MKILLLTCEGTQMVKRPIPNKGVGLLFTLNIRLNHFNQDMFLVVKNLIRSFNN